MMESEKEINTKRSRDWYPRLVVPWECAFKVIKKVMNARFRWRPVFQNACANKCFKVHILLFQCVIIAPSMAQPGGGLIVNENENLMQCCSNDWHAVGVAHPEIIRASFVVGSYLGNRSSELVDSFAAGTVSTHQNADASTDKGSEDNKDGFSKILGHLVFGIIIVVGVPLGFMAGLYCGERVLNWFDARSYCWRRHKFSRHNGEAEERKGML